jgi:hypothetical protein
MTNDLAGRAALSQLRQERLPANVVALCYPDLDFARDYPAYGRPGTPEEWSIRPTDLNGTAASLELYLGEDSLRNPGDGELYPVKWKRELRSGAFQGVVDHKAAVQQHFRTKVLAARRHGCEPDQDWSGVRLLLESLLNAHRAGDGPPPTG